MQSGMLITKIYGHDATDSTAAETVGPMADEVATNIELMPSPRPSNRAG